MPTKPKEKIQADAITEENAADASSASENVYVVQKDDTLWTIASKLLGRGDRCREIREFNNLTGNNIKAGQKLEIPER